MASCLGVSSPNNPLHQLSANLRSDLCFDWSPGLRSYFFKARHKKLLDLWSYDSPADFKKLLASPKDAISEDDQKCFFKLLSGDRNCAQEKFVATYSIKKYGPNPKSWDPVFFGREVLALRGAVTAREELTQLLRIQDSSHGEFERTLLENVKSLQLSSGNSIADLSAQQKSRILVALVNGYVSKSSRVVTAMENFRDELIKQGYQSQVMPTITSDDTIPNANRIAKALNDLPSDIDSIIIMGVSKGVSEISLTLNRRGRLSPQTLRKIKLVISMSGVIRYSQGAHWVLTHPEENGSLLLHGLLNWDLGADYWLGLLGLGNDSWPERMALPQHPEELSHILWISLVALPTLPTGLPEAMSGIAWVQNKMLRDLRDQIGPFDGFVESGASVLPPNTGMTQWIVPALASHFMLEGKFLDGSPVSPEFQRNSQMKTGPRFSLGALGLQKAILRSVPSSLLQ